MFAFFRENKYALCLVGITIMGSVLRLYHLTYQSFWYDELHSMVPTAPDLTIASIVQYAKTDQPPLFFIYLHIFFKVFGYSDFTGRLASAIIGILGIPAVYFLGKEVGSRKIGLFSAMLVTVNYYQIYYSQDVRFYSMAFLLSTLSFYFFVRIYKQQNLVNSALYVLSTSTLLYTHYFGMVVFASQFLIFLALIYYQRERQFIWTGLVCGVLVALSFAPWLPTVILDSGIQSFWITKPSPFFVVRYFFDYIGKDYFSAIVFLFLGALFANQWVKAPVPEKPIYVIIAGWIVFTYLLPFVKSVLGTPLLYIRYTIITLPAWFILLAMGWASIKNQRIRTVFFAGVMISSVLNLTLRMNYYNRIEKSQFREVSQVVKEKNTVNLPVYSSFSWHFNYYFKDWRYKVVQLPTNNFPSSFWLIQSHGQQEMQQELAKLTSTGFLVSKEYKFFQANAFLLEKK